MTTSVFNAKIGKVENKVPDTKGLVKKTDYNAKCHIQKSIVLLLIMINL